MGFDDAWSFETPIIRNPSVTALSPLIVLGCDSAQSFESPPKTNHGVTAPSVQTLLGSDSLKCQHKNRTNRPGQKTIPPVKEYLCFQIGGETAHDAHCYKSCELTKVIDLIIDIESF